MKARASRILLLELALTAGLLLPQSSAYSDAAPPLQPPGSALSPEVTTMVQMVAERVVLDVGDLLNDDGEILVDASFRMRNQGATPESLLVRFPLEHPLGFGDGYGGYPTIETVQVLVNGIEEPSGRATEPSYLTFAERPILWATFPVSFPVGTDVKITVRYSVKPTGNDYGTEVGYILETGAGWYGPIGLAEIIIRLPYPATEDNVLRPWNESTRSEWSTWDRFSLAQNTVVWRRWELEPTAADNFSFLIVPPQLWREALDLETTIANGLALPADYVRLSELYWDAVTDRHGFGGGGPLGYWAHLAVRNGLARYPRSGDLIAQSANLMLQRFWQNNIHVEQPYPAEVAAERQKIVCEVLRALAIDPSSSLAREMEQSIQPTSSERVACP